MEATPMFHYDELFGLINFHRLGTLERLIKSGFTKPIVTTKSEVRIFASDFLEPFTKTKWWVILLVWPPVICWCISKSLQMSHSLPHITLIVLYGDFLATLLEHTLHRFFFHHETKSYWGNTAHFLIHGFHHIYPMDELLLVFPPVVAAVILVPVWKLVKLLSTPSTSPSLFGGVVLGYVIYDLTHHYLHYGKPTSNVPRNLKKHHLNHHFHVHDRSFGVTSSLWDKVYGTLPGSKVAQ